MEFLPEEQEGGVSPEALRESFPEAVIFFSGDLECSRTESSKQKDIPKNLEHVGPISFVCRCSYRLFRLSMLSSHHE